jgi:branched-chain amino acid transport system substrate-binding protein
VTDRGLWNVFRTCGRDDQQGVKAASYIARNLHDKRIAIVHDKTTYGMGLAEITKETLNALGVHEVLYDGITPSQKDYSSLIDKIGSTRAEVLYWGGLELEGGMIVREMRAQGMDTTMISGDGIASEEFADIGGPGVAGTLMTFPPDPRRRPEAQDVVKEFAARNFDPEAHTLYSYAAVQIIKQAIERAGTLDTKSVAVVMHSGMTFKTVIGDISFDKHGDIRRMDYIMYKWSKEDDGIIRYRPFEDPTVDCGCSCSEDACKRTCGQCQ